MKYRIYILLLCLFAVLTTSAQQDTLKVKVPKQRFFESVSVGIDAVGPALDKLSGYGDYQAFLQFNIKGKYLPVLELGYGRSNETNESTHVNYKTKAPFGRIGFDYNISKNKHDDYRVMVGVRYGLTSFNFDTSSPVDSTLTRFNTVTEKCTVHWAEVVFGVDAKVWGPLHLGWALRYRRRLNTPSSVNPPLYAPGYGNAAEGTRFMGTYTISLQF